MPAPLPRSQSGALLDGLRFLSRRPAWTLGLVLLGTLLGQLGPALELLAKGDSNPVLRLTLTLLVNLPFVFFCIPWWISRLDADLKDLPANPKKGWPGAFDRRWWRAVWPALLILFSAWIGCFLILPGAVILIFAGFVPARMLLRDEAFGPSLQWNFRTMVRFWQKMAPSGMAALLVLLGGVLGLLMILSIALEGQGQSAPGALFLLTHPLVWLAQALQTLLLLWISGMVLSMYHRLEALDEDAAPHQPK